MLKVTVVLCGHTDLGGQRRTQGLLRETLLHGGAPLRKPLLFVTLGFAPDVLRRRGYAVRTDNEPIRQ